MTSEERFKAIFISKEKSFSRIPLITFITLSGQWNNYSYFDGLVHRLITTKTKSNPHV